MRSIGWPVCDAISSFIFARRYRISFAATSMSAAVPCAPPDGWCIMMHQPSGGAQGTAADIEVAAKEILYLRAKMNELMASHTGQPIERIERDFDRDYYMSADEAKAYGIIDEVITAPGTIVD